jgi:hypothetical protein
MRVPPRGVRPAHVPSATAVLRPAVGRKAAPVGG